MGLGKTLLACIVAHEMNRMGLARKVLITGIKANIDKVAQEYSIAYPQDKVLYPSEEDFSPKNRTRLLYDIAHNDWNAVILTHEQFAKIPQPFEMQKAVIQNEIEAAVASLDAFEEAGGNINDRMLSGLRIRIRNLTAKLSTVLYRMETQKDNVLDFSKMGIEHIIADECHTFKNLTFQTRHFRVAGIGNPEGSQRALNMHLAVRQLQERFDDDLQASFLSGTILSNSLVESYSLFRTLRPRALARQGIKCFDAWAATFTRKSTELEVSVTGELAFKERFRYFIKVPEMSLFYREIADCKNARDIGLDEPQVEFVMHLLDQTPEQQEFTRKLVAFAKSGQIEHLGLNRTLNDSEKKAYMLIATSYASKMAVDMRLIDPVKYHDHPGNKASHIASEFAREYHKYASYQGTQLIFGNLGTWKPGGEWNIYSEIKRKLTQEYHIPASELRFIQEANSVQAKNTLTEAINEGTIRGLFGSATTLGTGNNVQRRVTACHFIDIPWTFKDLDQCVKRMARYGNWLAKNQAGNKTYAHIYGHKNTLDAYRFALILNKRKFTRQFKEGGLTTRTLDEGAIYEDGAVSLAEYVSLLTGNETLLEKTKLESQIADMDTRRESFYRERSGHQRSLEQALESERAGRQRIENMEKDLEHLQRKAPCRQDGERTASLELNGITGTDTATLAARLKRLGQVSRTNGLYETVGSYAGFPVQVRTRLEFTDRGEASYSNRFFVQSLHDPDLRYSYNNGILAEDKKLAVGNFSKALDKLPELIRERRKALEEKKADIKVLERLASLTWTEDDKIAEMKGRLFELEEKLQNEARGIQRQRLIEQQNNEKEIEPGQNPTLPEAIKMKR